MKKIWHNARTLRHNATDAERKLWQHLKSRQVLGLKFRRQFPIAGFVADFACFELGLVIELDGGQHVDRASLDDARTLRIEANGYRVLRFWNDDVLLRTNAVMDEVYRQVDMLSRAKSTPPRPSAARRGGSDATAPPPARRGRLGGGASARVEKSTPPRPSPARRGGRKA
jgi:very-short-patch-repair endonuclease